MLNIDLLRKAQASIADPEKYFNMGSWCSCIAAHIMRAANANILEFAYHCDFRVDVAAKTAGLDFGVAEDLFGTYCTRSEAVEKLEDLIQVALACSALEPCAQRAAARAEEGTEAESKEEELVCV